MTKRIISVFALLFAGAISVNAQNYDDMDPMAHRHEVKVNLAKTILARTPEFAYEYILKPDMSVGGRIGFALGENEGVRQTMGDFQAMPYVRWFFTSNGETARRVAKGFFAEVNMAFTSYKSYVDMYSEMDGVSRSSALGVGVGLAIGWKYVSRSGWTCDLTYGAGRNFSGLVDWYAVGGLTVGKRF